MILHLPSVAELRAAILARSPADRWEPSEPCGQHRGPEGPNEDIAQCPRCWAPVGMLRPEGETFGDHLPDCSLPLRHGGYCQPRGSGHPRAAVIRG